MKNEGLPARSLMVFWAIIAYKSKHDGCSPALTDLMRVCNIRSKSTVNRHLTILEEAGLIHNANGTHARKIEVVGGNWVWAPPKSWKRERQKETTDALASHGQKDGQARKGGDDERDQ